MTVKTYLKLYGPPILKALEKLENISIDMPEVCIMDQLITLQATDPQFRYTTGSGIDTLQGIAETYFEGRPISRERCSTIISKSGESLGEYDFFFEWFTKPTFSDLRELIKKIDEELEPLGAKYTLTTLED
jgi:hypothetical protein